MSSKNAMVPNKPRRLPRKGGIFLLARSVGLLCKVVGFLLLGIAVAGFFIMLVRIGPTIVGSIQYSHQKIAGLIFIISLTYLLIFPIIGLVGAVAAGIGFALGHVGTEPAMSTSIIEPDQAQTSQLKEPPTKGAI